MFHATSSVTRRQVLRTLPAALLTPPLSRLMAADAASDVQPKRVAAIATVYRPNSHADVILTKILEGWKHEGGPGPKLELAGMYLDQFPEDDMSRRMSEKHGVPIYDRISDALTLGEGRVAVDGVLSIGEHGDYPYNERRQHLYPRYRFFTEIADTFEKHGQVVPVFNDKHLSTVWEEALAIYERATAMQIPLMAGSSIPVSYRRPAVEIPMGSSIKAIVGVGYSGLDIYGFHALEFLQAFAERRAGAEQGVAWVECLEGEAIWQAVDQGRASGALLQRALEVVPTESGVDLRTLRGDDVALLLFQYRDGPLGALFMLAGYAQGIGVAAELKNRPAPVAAYAEERAEPRYPHFACLTKGIEQMVLWGKPVYPVERTLLSGGILDRALHSKEQQGKRLETPELAISYQPVDYPFGDGIDLADPEFFRPG